MPETAVPAPSVSVIVPLYQCARYVEGAIHSVLAQTFRDFEIIVVDDGSKDEGPDIVRRIADPRIRIVTKPNGGLASARNAGIRVARGRYVALLDADDWWEPEKLERHVEHLDRDPTIGLSLSPSRMVDDDGRDLGLVQVPSDPPYDARQIFCRNPVGNGSVAVIRRVALDRCRTIDAQRGTPCWFDEDFRRSEDIELWLRLAVIGRCRFAAIDEPLTVYRINQNGLSANTDAQLESWLAVRRKLKTYAPELEASTGDLAEAFQRRYLARRAIRARERVKARRLMYGALRLAPSMAFREPGKTLTTVVAIAALHALPANLAGTLERLMLRAMPLIRRAPAPLAPAVRRQPG